MRPSVLLRNAAAHQQHGQQKPISPHVGFYKMYGRPLTRVLLMTSITYYGLHWVWWALEMESVEKDKQSKIEQLSEQLGDAVSKR
ncbi:hypothetical protein PYCC9005_002700 [Savitreella phatthalungensis]